MNDVMGMYVINALEDGANNGRHFIISKFFTRIPPFLDEIFKGSVSDDFHS